MDWTYRLDVIADIAQYISLGAIVFAIWQFKKTNQDNRKRFLDHVQLHLAKISRWAKGGEGWYESDATVEQMIVWSNPGHTVYTLNSVDPLSSLTLSGTVLIQNYNTKRALVGLSQSLTNFNNSVEKIIRLQTSDPLVSASIAKKISMLVSGSNMSRFITVQDGYREAGLTQTEIDLAVLLASANKALHLFVIGSPNNQESLAAWLKNAQTQLFQEQLTQENATASIKYMLAVYLSGLIVWLISGRFLLACIVTGAALLVSWVSGKMDKSAYSGASGVAMGAAQASGKAMYSLRE